MPIAHWAVRRRPPELGDRNLAPTHSLAHLEALELRMVDVERLVLARILVGGAEFLRPCPGFERRLALPNGVRGIEREVLVLGSLEEVEFDKAGHLGQLRIAAEPHLLEGLFGTFLHAEAVHGDEHGLVPCFNGARINLEMSAT
jgi:hypothetical protein